MIRRAFYTCGLVLSLFAQESTQQHVTARAASAARGSRLELLNATLLAISHLDSSKLKPVPERGLERELAEGGSRSAALVLNRNLGSVTGAYTVVTDFGDVLVARWESKEDTWLWDSPWQTVFLLRIPRELLLNPDLLSRYCEDLLVWSKPPIHLSAVTLLRFVATDGNPTWVQGRGTHKQQERGLLQWQLVASETGGGAFIAISISKPFLSGFYYYWVIKEHFDVELFCGITPFRARPTRETLRGIYRGPGERRGA